MHDENILVKINELSVLKKFRVYLIYRRNILHIIILKQSSLRTFNLHKPRIDDVVYHITIMLKNIFRSLS